MGVFGFRGMVFSGLCAGILCCAGVAQAESWPSLDRVSSFRGGGEQDAAVIVGVEDYLVVQDVPGAVRNTNAWYKDLVKGRGVPQDRVFLLRDGEGVREKILKAAQDAAAKVGPGGTLWFVFVGHGAPGMKGDEGVLVGADAQGDPESLYARSVSRSELLSSLSRGGQARTVVAVDACFSGLAGDGSALTRGLQPLVPMQGDASLPSGVLWFSAGTSSQFAGPLPGADRPAFSYLLLGALRGWADENEDQNVSAREAIVYTQRAMASVVKGREQTPVFYGEGEALLATGAKEKGPDLVSLVLEAPRVVRPVVPGGGLGAGQLRLRVLDKDAYAMTVVASDGHFHECSLEGERGGTCDFRGLPPGRTSIKVRGAATQDREINLGAETFVMEVDGAEGWYGWASLGFLGGGFVTAVVGLTSVVADDDRDGLGVGGFAAIAGAPVMYTTSLVFGVLWLLDKDKVEVRRFEKAQRGDAVRWDVSAEGVGFSW